MEVHITNPTTTTTIELMRKSFATLGLPDVIVSDNAANFTSMEFSTFMKRSGIKHVRTPLYHPSSNGIAEMVVQTLKDGLRKIKEGSLETRLSRFLFKYRITPHSITGISPSEIMFGRRLHSHLDHLRPHLEKKANLNYDRQRSTGMMLMLNRVFKMVYIRNYAPGPQWLPGKIIELHGNVLFTVLLEDGRRVKKHTDQIIYRYEGSTTQETDDDLSEDPTVSSTPKSLPMDTPQTLPTQSPLTTEPDHSSPISSPSLSSRSSTSDRSSQTPEPVTPCHTDRPVRRSTRSRHSPKRYESPVQY